MFDNFDMSASLLDKLLYALPIALFGIMMVFSLLVLLAVCIMLISKGVQLGEKLSSKKKKKDDTAPANALTAPQNNGTALPDSQSAGSMDLYEVDEKTAAVIMAIVSEESGIPLNRLLFKSIKKVD